MGPMATCVSDLELFCRATLGHCAPDVMPLAHRASEDKAGSCVRIQNLTHLWMFSPLCKGLFQETIDKLKANGIP